MKKLYYIYDVRSDFYIYKLVNYENGTVNHDLFEFVSSRYEDNCKLRIISVQPMDRLIRLSAIYFDLVGYYVSSINCPSTTATISFAFPKKKSLMEEFDIRHKNGDEYFNHDEVQNLIVPWLGLFHRNLGLKYKIDTQESIKYIVEFIEKHMKTIETISFFEDLNSYNASDFFNEVLTKLKPLVHRTDKIYFNVRFTNSLNSSTLTEYEMYDANNLVDGFLLRDKIWQLKTTKRGVHLSEDGDTLLCGQSCETLYTNSVIHSGTFCTKCRTLSLQQIIQ